LGRYKIWLGLAAVFAVVTAGIAVASEPPAQTQAVAATFEADVKRFKTHMCKGSDGTYKVTHAVYWGTATSDNPALNGRIRLHLKSFYNVDEKLGKVSGDVYVRNEEMERGAKARLLAVNSDGKLEGMLIGVAGRPRARLFANFAGSLSDSGVEGQLGGGSSGNLALLFSRGCEREQWHAKVKERVHEQRKQERTDEQKEHRTRPDGSGK
jgi:hypothetical protein